MYRRIALFFCSMVEIIQFLYLVIIPPTGLYTIYDSITLTSISIFLLTLVIVYYYFFICSYYASLPFYERKYRLRYYLKMLGTDSKLYFISMILCDTVIATCLMILTYGLFVLLYWGNYDLSDFRFSEGVPVFIGLILWNVSFIVQSYFFQSYFKTTVTDVKRVPMFMLISNLILIPVL